MEHGMRTTYWRLRTFENSDGYEEAIYCSKWNFCYADVFGCLESISPFHATVTTTTPDGLLLYFEPSDEVCIGFIYARKTEIRLVFSI